MNNPFLLSDEKLKTLLEDYSVWCESDEKEGVYSDVQKQKAEDLRKTLLNGGYLSKVSDGDLAKEIFNYSRTLEGPAFIRLGMPRISGELDNVKRNLLYLTESPDGPFKKAARILDGDYKIQVFAKAFWSPLFQAQYPTTLPNWNNKTERFLKRLGINFATSKKSVEEKYEMLSEAFLYLQQLDPKQDFYNINHLMHYGTEIPEGIALVNELLDPGGIRYWQIAPGEGARLWEDLLKNSIAAVGWNEIKVSLAGKSKEELLELYKNAYPNATDREMKIGIRQLMNFLSIKPGDRIITNQGKTSLLAVGEVKSGYLFRPNREEYRHTIDVDYYRVSDGGIPIPQKFRGKFGKTIVPLKKEEFIALEQLFAPVEKRSWIFQASPEHYDIDSALSSISEIRWEIRQHKSEVSSGDTVYIWRSGKNAGVIAIAEVLSEPKEMPLDDRELGFIKSADKFGEVALRARVGIRQVLKNPILKDTLSAHPILKNLTIMKSWQHTNYLLTPEQAEALVQVIDDEWAHGPSFWWVCQGDSYTPDKGYNFLYAPNRDKAGNTPFHWANIKKIKKDDVIFNYANGFIRAVSVAKDAGFEFFDEGGEKWEKGGTRVDIEHFQIEDIPHAKLKNNKKSLLKALEGIRGPFDKNGDIKQGYLFEFNYKAAEIVRELYGKPFPDQIEKHFRESVEIETTQKETWEEIKGDLVVRNLGSDFRIDTLYFEDRNRIEKRVQTALKNGNNIILIGPPGTGKSKLAKEICEFYCDQHGYIMSTATSDWSTFETIGGYRPDSQGELKFYPGIFLQCLQNQNRKPINRWLVIDEINRADIDKAFGSLFSALTGDNISLPFEISDEPLQIIGNPLNDMEIKNNLFIIPSDWRIIATMNTYDKASLYEMSYAFMRRFAFVPVDVPKNISVDLLERYLEIWGLKIDEKLCSDLAVIWSKVNGRRKVGPAIIEDIYKHVQDSESFDYASAITMYVLPQFEGLIEDQQIEFIKEIALLDFMNDIVELKYFASDFFDLDIAKLV